LCVTILFDFLRGSLSAETGSHDPPVFRRLCVMWSREANVWGRGGFLFSARLLPLAHTAPDIIISPLVNNETKEGPGLR